MLKAVAASGSGAAGGITIGTSIITGGTNTRVLFDDNGVIGENAGLTFTKGSGTLAATIGNFATSITIGAGSAITSSGAGGALGSNAFTSTAYAPIASPQFTGNVNNTILGSTSSVAYGFNSVKTGFYSGGQDSSVITTVNGADQVIISNNLVQFVGGVRLANNSNGAIGLSTATFMFGTANNTILGPNGNFSITVATPNTAVASTAAANVNLTAGNASGTGAPSNGGSVVITAGTSTNGTAGTIQLASITTTVSTDAASSTGGALQIAGGASVAKRFWLPAITASSGLQTAVLCQSSGGEVIADSVACLASSARFKDMMGKAESGALDKIIKVPIQKWKYRRDPDSVFPDNYYSEHIGPTAEDIEAIDSRLVGRDQEGKARSISTDQLLALAIQAIQEQQVQIDELKVLAA